MLFLLFIMTACSKTLSQVSVPTVNVNQEALEQDESLIFGSNWFMMLPEKWTIDRTSVRTKHTQLVANLNNELTLLIEAKIVDSKNVEPILYMKQEIEEYAKTSSLRPIDVVALTFKKSPGSLTIFKSDDGDSTVVQLVLFLDKTSIVIYCGGDSVNDDFVAHECTEVFRQIFPIFSHLEA